MIDNFHDGEHDFLSNFFGDDGTDVERYYQSEKTINPKDRFTILMATSPAQAKKLGRQVKMRSGWDDMKLEVMRELLEWKFSDPELAAKLLATGDEELVEGNTWGDTYWGICRGKGENHLGRLLMDIRGQLREYAANEGSIS